MPIHTVQYNNRVFFCVAYDGQIIIMWLFPCVYVLLQMTQMLRSVMPLHLHITSMLSLYLQPYMSQVFSQNVTSIKINLTGKCKDNLTGKLVVV